MRKNFWSLVTGHWSRVTIYGLLVVLMFGCATAKAPAKKRLRSTAPAAAVQMEPRVEIPRAGIQKVFVGDFESRSAFKGAGVVFAGALRSKFLEKGFELAESESGADLAVEGEVARCTYKRARVGLVKAVAGRLAYGKEAQLYEVDMSANVELLAQGKSYSTRLSGKVKTHESEIALAVNDAGLVLAEKLVKSLK